MYSIYGVPEGLLDDTRREEDVSILVGENGSGKSTILQRIAKFSPYLTPSSTIAIANTIHDKFDMRSNRLKVLRSSRGRSIVKQAIKDIFKIISVDKGSRMYHVTKILDHVGFDEVVGIRLKGLKRNFIQVFDYVDIGSAEAEEIAYVLRPFSDGRSYDEIYRVPLFSRNPQIQQYTDVLKIFELEGKLKKFGIVKEIEVFLFRGDKEIPIVQASSGELTMITTFLYIAATIEMDSLILIDEPENSLHPRWQTEYVKLLIDFFYYYRPKVIIATHSPLIINAADIFADNIRVFKGVAGEFRPIRHSSQNVEELYKDYFDIITPKNRLLSEVVVDYINRLSQGSITLDAYINELTSIRDSSYSPEQEKVLNEVLEMGRKIIDSRGK